MDAHATLQDACYLIQVMATTAFETTVREEEDEREILSTLYRATTVSVAAACSMSDLQNNEGAERSSILVDELCTRNQLHVRSRLVFHGYPVDMSFAVQPPETEVRAETWRSLPTLFPPSNETILVPTVGELCTQLHQQDGTSDTFVFELLRDHLEAKERSARATATSEWDRDISRMKRQSDDFLEGLRKLEKELIEVGEEIIMRNMTFEEKVVYKTAPVVDEEYIRRLCTSLLEQSSYDDLILHCAEEVSWTDLITRFVAGREEIRANSVNDKLTRLQRGSWKCHTKVRFGEWKKWATHTGMMRRGRTRTAVLADAAVVSLLKRYAAYWNATPEARRVARQRADFWEAHMEAYLLLVITEEEERHRTTEYMNEHTAFLAIADTCFEERDGIRHCMLLGSVDALVSRNAKRHMMRRLITWHKLWKKNSYQRRCQWLLTNTTRRQGRGHFDKLWMHARMNRTRRQNRVLLYVQAVDEKQQEECIASEAALRERLRLEESVEVSQAAHDRTVDAKCARRSSQKKIVLSMAEKNSVLHTSLRLASWILFHKRHKMQAAARKLEAKNRDLYWHDVFGRFTQPYVCKKRKLREALAETDMVFACKGVTESEENEQRTRLCIESHEDWLRARYQFRLKNNATFKKRTEAMECQSGATLRTARYRTWCRHRLHRHHISRCKDIVDHKNYERDLDLWRRYYTLLRDFAADAKETRRKSELLRISTQKCEELLKMQNPARSEIEEDEQWNFTRIMLAHARSIKMIWRKQQTAIVEALAVVRAGQIQRRYFATLCRHRAHRQFLRSLLPKIDSMAVRSKSTCCRRFYKHWVNYWWARIRPRLAAEMEKRTLKVLMRRYYRNLSPLTVRLARVARAKLSLQKAQVAARLLDRDVDAQRQYDVFVMRSHNPFLPPILRPNHKTPK